MPCLRGFELDSRWVPLYGDPAAVELNGPPYGNPVEKFYFTLI